MQISASHNIQIWGWRALLGVGILGFCFAIAEDLFPALRPQSKAQVQAQNFCSTLIPGTLLQDVRTLASKEQFKLLGSDDDMFIKFTGGCVCSIQLSQGKVIKNAALCNW